MFAVFPVMKQLHEMLWYLAEARDQPAAHSLRDDVARLTASTEGFTRRGPDALANLDLTAHRRDVGAVLDRVSQLVRAAAPSAPANRRGADLIGAKLHGADLRWADLLGADFRGADLSGARLTGCLFLTQPQVNAARGDAATQLPPRLARPPYWSAA